MLKKIVFLLFLIGLFTLNSAECKVVESTGEALIQNGDIGAAKNQAIIRAKWAALENAAQVNIKVETIVQNAILVDESIKSEVSGAVKNYTILDEGKDGDTYWVKIKAEVEPKNAVKTVSIFAKNTSISVLLPVVFPDGRVLESSPLSEKIINELVLQNFEVVDIASLGNPYSIEQLNNAMKNNDFLTLRSLAYRALSGVLLVGKVESIATAKEGKNVGYGINLPFNIVSGKLTYRLIGTKNGQKIILDSGYVTARGQAASVDDAVYNMLENLSYEVTNRIISSISEKIRGIENKKVEIVLAGNTDVDKLLQLKNDLQYIAWVLNIETQGTDKLVLDYPEKVVYLANAIEQKRDYSIKKINDRQIILEENR